jgi:peroxiredoxin
MPRPPARSIRPDGVFPGYSLPDPTGMVRTLSELQGRDRLILLLARGNYCPEEHHQHLELAANYPKVAVGYTRIVTISADDHHTTQEFRASAGAEWTFLSDTARSTPAADVVLDMAALTDRPLRRELAEGGAKAGSRLRGPLPLLWQPPEAALPGSGKYGPTASGLHPHVRYTKDGGGRSSSQHPPLFPRSQRGAAGPLGLVLPAAAASTVTLRRFRS